MSVWSGVWIAEDLEPIGQGVRSGRMSRAVSPSASTGLCSRRTGIEEINRLGPTGLATSDAAVIEEQSGEFGQRWTVDCGRSHHPTPSVRATVANLTVGPDAGVPPMRHGVRLRPGSATSNVRPRAILAQRASDPTVRLTCPDGRPEGRANMVSRCLRCRHETEIYVRSTVSTGTNGER